MAEATPNPASENAQAEPRDPEGIDAAAEAFASQGQQAQPEDEAEPAQEPADESDTEAVEADPEAEEPAEELAEVEYEGKTYSVPPELQKAILRQADYSRKMNEVSAKEQTFTQRLEQIDTLATGAEKYSEALATVRTLEAQLASMQSIDWDQLEADNPTQAASLAVRQLRLQQAHQKATADVNSVREELGSTRQKLLNDARADMDKALKKDLPGWGDELGTKLTRYATEKGVQLKTLSQLTDPAMVVALDKARRFDELQASKTAIKAKAQAAPQVTKPGAPRKADPKSDAMARLRKSNSIDDAAAAFLAVGR
jgi:hypothetical protein